MVEDACLYVLMELLWASAKCKTISVKGGMRFTAQCYASAVLAMGLCLSVCLSVTSRSSTKTAKRRITQTTLHDSTGTVVF